ECSVGLVAVRLEVARELKVGLFGRDPGAPPEVAQERYVRHHSDDSAGQRRHGDRDAAALAVAGDDDPISVDERVAADKVDGADGVGVDAAVKVFRWVLDA